MSGSKRAIDQQTQKIVQQWRDSGLSQGSIDLYLIWVRRFQKYCLQKGFDEHSRLTDVGVDRFRKSYVGLRKGQQVGVASRTSARNALRAWAYALSSLGESVPLWAPPHPDKKLSPLLEEYRRYRKEVKGVSDSTVRRDIEVADGFITYIRTKRKGVVTVRVSDIDEFLEKLSARRSKRTLAETCSSLRAFLRFLLASGKIKYDLATAIIAPRVRKIDRPPRALAWKDVRRILSAIPRDRRIGKRDYAMLLMMATYGLGAAEVLGLRLEDIDWTGNIVRVRRPKTSAVIELPLLPSVAKALAMYLHSARPFHVATRKIFVAVIIPHAPLTSGSIRHRIREYAYRAGIKAEILGAHILRHSHACRQVDTGANIKVVSDILRHQSTSSTSVYVRVALQRLRHLSLPVPR